MKWQAGHDATTTGEYIGCGNTTTDAWGSVAQRLWLPPGLHTIDRVALRLALGESCTDQAYVVVFDYNSSTGACTTLGRQAVVNPNPGVPSASFTEVTQTYDVSIQVMAGTLPVYVGIFYQRLGSINTVGTNRPGARGVIATTQRPTASSGTAPSILRVVIPAASGVDLPLTFTHNVGAGLLVQGNHGNAVYCRWTSANGVMATTAAYSGTAIGYSLPTPVDGVGCFYVFTNVIVADGNALTVSFRDGTASEVDLVIDMGATDRITFNGQHINLPTINSLAQAGDSFDVAVYFAPNNGGIDVFVSNRTKGTAGLDTSGTNKYSDIATWSHNCARTGLRGQLVALQAPETTYISGTASFDSLKVIDASAMVVAMVDSQVSGKNDAGDTTYLQRLGQALADVLDGHLWNAGIAGGKFDSDSTTLITAGKTRYNGTVGVNDLVDMVQFGAALCLCGPGINDISQGVSSAATAVSVPAAVKAAVGTILADLGDGSAFIFGLPCYSDANASQFDVQAIRNLNRHYYELAIQYGVGYMATFRAMSDGARYGDGVQQWRPGLSADELHYNDTSAAIVAGQLERARAGIIDDAADREPDAGHVAAGFGPDPMNSASTPNL